MHFLSCTIHPGFDYRLAMAIPDMFIKCLGLWADNLNHQQTVVAVMVLILVIIVVIIVAIMMIIIMIMIMIMILLLVLLVLLLLRIRIFIILIIRLGYPPPILQVVSFHFGLVDTEVSQGGASAVAIHPVNIHPMKSHRWLLCGAFQSHGGTPCISILDWDFHGFPIINIYI